MKPKDIIPISLAILKAKIFNIRTPLALSINLTSRCNQRCLYCGVWENQIPELTTDDLKSMILSFKNLGTRYISFTGGEPLLRDDIEELINFVIDQKLYLNVSSNGQLVPEKIHSLKKIDELRLSLDGPLAIHDKLRGKGSFLKTMEAVKAAKQLNIKVTMQCVISNQNLNAMDHILRQASEAEVKVYFQPATEHLLWITKNNGEIPSIDKYREVITLLIDAKKNGKPVKNSLSCLKHLYHWPNRKKIKCVAGLLCCEALPNGALITCFRMQKNKILHRQLNRTNSFKNLKLHKNCKECWACGPVEFNMMTSFHLDSIFDYLND